MVKKIKENIKDDEKLKNDIKDIIQDSLLIDDSKFQQQNIKDIDAVKIIINELGVNKKLLPATTNLTTKQIHGIAKLKTVNKIFKSPLIDDYITNIQELKRSETKEPFSMLKGLFDLANNQSNQVLEEPSIMQKFLGRKGR